MKKIKLDWLQVLILALPFCGVVLLWDKLPARLPSHWNLHGEVDGYASKGFGTLFLPILNVAVAALIAAICPVDPRVRKQDPETKASSLRTFRAVRLIFSTFLSGLCLALLWIAMGLPLEAPRAIGVGVSIMFLGLGNLMGKLRPNYFVGIRTPWTLESREVWLKTHRLGGKLMVAASLLLLMGCLILPTPIYLWLYAPMILLMGLTPIIYSFVLYRRQQETT